MVVRGRLVWLRDQVAAGVRTYLTIGSSSTNQRGKIKAVLHHGAPLAPIASRRMHLAVLDAIVPALQDMVAVDRGHRSSGGISEIHLWFSAVDLGSGFGSAPPGGGDGHGGGPDQGHDSDGSDRRRDTSASPADPCAGWNDPWAAALPSTAFAHSPVAKRPRCRESGADVAAGTGYAESDEEIHRIDALSDSSALSRDGLDVWFAAESPFGAIPGCTPNLLAITSAFMRVHAALEHLSDTAEPAGPGVDTSSRKTVRFTEAANTEHFPAVDHSAWISEWRLHFADACWKIHKWVAFEEFFLWDAHGLVSSACWVGRYYSGYDPSKDEEEHMGSSALATTEDVCAYRDRARRLRLPARSHSCSPALGRTTGSVLSDRLPWEKLNKRNINKH